MSILQQAIDAVNKYPLAFCKFISANEAGKTGSHQAGIYIPKGSYPILFNIPGRKGENKDRSVTIRWQDDFETVSRFIWYGQGTRSEYRITRFGRGFPFLQDENVGDLFILVKATEDDYLGYILQSDEEIEEFLAAFGMSTTETNSLITKTQTVEEPPDIEKLFREYISSIQVDFPTTQEISQAARKIFIKYSGSVPLGEPDKLLLNWLDTEYRLFKAIELDRYRERLQIPFTSIDELIECANTLLNRRKSRAGKALENHLSEVFTIHKIPFSSQAVTEGNKKPDFIFPGADAYHNKRYPRNKLVFLGAKTTCKDRWRQILNEADEIPLKHLFTLQQGISENQLKEMYTHNVVLVVPKEYHNNFPKTFRERILSLKSFITMVKERCG